MPRTAESLFPVSRMQELALRAEKTGQACFSPFLTPVEAEAAQAAARRACVQYRLFGGYEDAERQIAGFALEAPEERDFPISALELRWPHQAPPSHRDLLGSVMGLGIQRQCLGDIQLQDENAFLFATNAMAQHIASSLSQAGKTHLQVAFAKELPSIAPAEGIPFRDTVPSLRLDAIMASGFSLSRAKATALVEAGHVKLRHVQTLRPDAKVELGDMISVRGMGRVQLAQVSAPTRKDRLPVVLNRFGIR